MKNREETQDRNNPNNIERENIKLNRKTGGLNEHDNRAYYAAKQE